MLLQINLQVEGELYANCYFHILAFQGKFFLFWFLSCGIHMDISIVTGFQKGQISS